MMFDSPLKLLLGFITGLAFGVFLQKGRVAKHSVIVGQLLFRDFTVLKIMLTAIAVGAVGFWSLVALGVTDVSSIKPAQLGGVLAGAFLFGSGLAVLGYCPGTTVAAVGEGHRDAIAGLFGMLAGAFVFVLGYPWLHELQSSLVDWGELTLPAASKIAPAAFVLMLLIAAASAYAIPKLRRNTHARGSTFVR
jgi:uncharacterized membrane protein YedE/YeeE